MATSAIPRALEPLPLAPLPERPLVSVLVANYNYGQYVGEAIESLLGQTYERIEVIVCDDASTDDSTAIIERYVARDARVRLIRAAENRGQAAATNAAFAISRGDILCVLDSDDIYTPDKVEQVVRRFQEAPRAGLVIHRGLMVDRDRRPIQEIPYATRFESGWLAERLIRRGGRWRDMPNVAMSFRRELTEFVFPLPEEDFRTATDCFISTLLPLLTEVATIDRVLFHYRMHGDNDTGHAALSIARLSKYVRFSELQTTYVNQRLAELGVTGRDLDLRRNLRYREETLQLALLRGDARAHLARRLARLVRPLLADDLYGWGLKLLLLLIYGLAIPLPQPLRQRWLNATFGYTVTKRRLRRLLRWARAHARTGGAKP